MAIELFTKRVPASEAPSIVPPATFVLVPGRTEDIAKLEQARSNYPLWHTHLTGPKRSRPEENWYWTLLGKVGEGLGRHPKTLHAELRYLAGKVLETIRSPLLGEHFDLKSSRDMDYDEYHAYVVLAVDIIFTHESFLRGVRRKDILDEIYRQTGVHTPT